ncbi:MAG: VOC family protein [Phycisphaerae bacterium]|nr:VOC family protein [Phycisphaerae bacterium]
MPSPIVHFEIGCQNSEKAKKFYGDLFGWTFDSYGPAAMVSNIGHGPDGTKRSDGIGGHLNSLGHPPHQYVTIYAMVEDVQAALDKAVRLGGKACVPVTEVPGMGWFAWFTDPEGNTIGLWKTMTP